MNIFDAYELKLLSFSFNGKAADFVVEDDLDTEDKYLVSFSTSCIICHHYLEEGLAQSRFHFEVANISDFLSINENSQYIIPNNYNDAMKCSRLGLCAGIGRNSAVLKKVVFAKGSQLYYTLLIKDESDIIVIKK